MPLKEKFNVTVSLGTRGAACHAGPQDEYQACIKSRRQEQVVGFKPEFLWGFPPERQGREGEKFRNG